MTQRKYLIIAPSWVGDMVMAQSLFIYLKQLYPNCIINVIAPSSSLPLTQFMLEVSEFFLGDFKHGEFSLTKRYKFGKQLRSKGYTHSIVLPNSWKSALIPFAAKIPQRTGWKGEARYGLLNDIRTLDKDKYPLMIERFDALAVSKGNILEKALPFPTFEVPETLIHETKEKFKLAKSTPARKIIALCPGAEFGPAKKWPSNYYAEAANILIEQGYDIWLFGGPGDISTTQEIEAHIHKKACVKNFAGKTKLPEAIALLSLVNAVLSNDSGLMHIACALDKKTFVIYGSTSDKFTPPLHEHAQTIYLDDLTCRPCFKRECPLGHMDCLNKLTPKLVTQKFLAYLH